MRSQSYTQYEEQAAILRALNHYINHINKQIRAAQKSKDDIILNEITRLYELEKNIIQQKIIDTNAAINNLIEKKLRQNSAA